MNHQGTTEVITDKDGTIVWDTRLSVYGSVLTANGSKSFTPTYTGKDLDSDTGLYYFNFRWYAACRTCAAPQSLLYGASPKG